MQAFCSAERFYELICMSEYGGRVIVLNEQCCVAALHRAELQNILHSCIKVRDVAIAAVEKIVKMKTSNAIRSD